MTPEETQRLAAELAGTIVAARVSAAAGRPTFEEGKDAARYYRVILHETRRALGLAPITDPEPDAS
jgi:hypothetical protein